MSRHKLAAELILESGGALLKGNPRPKLERTVEEITGADNRLETRYT